MRILERIDQVSAADWNGLLAGRDEAGYHPFTDWHFLNALEQSQSVGPQNTGWQICHLWVTDEDDKPCGAAPFYIKYHSRGEYVFDQAWANASERAGLPYYPKLQSCIPFTPATGPRLIATSKTVRDLMVHAMTDLCDKHNLSGVHLSFTTQEQQAELTAHGFLPRIDRQFHFINRDYQSFDDFLTSMTSRKRKKIKAERRKSLETGISMMRLRGDDIKPHHWDAFYGFYLDTSNRKWGQAYLTRGFFEHIQETMRDQVLLIMAYDDGRPVAGALNFIGGDTLYGRNWGANQYVPFLHFELCYYQAIEAAIDMGLSRVEAGAQGEHKLARGYEAHLTHSAHKLRHEGLHNAIANYLEGERDAIDHEIEILDSYAPFKQKTD